MASCEADLRLDKVHQGLPREIENAQQNLPMNVEEVTEAFERHARIIALLVRSLEAMLRLEKQKNQEQQKTSDPQTRTALLAGIEKRLDELADQQVATTFDFSRTLPRFTIPSHSLFFGITGLVSKAMIGPSSWQLGTADGLNRFGSDLAIAMGTMVNGPADPPSVYWSPTPLVLTPKGGAFRSGELKLDMFYLTLPIPSL